MENAKQQLMDKITTEWADHGKILEGGWQAFLAVGISPDAPESQKAAMRMAYYLGAQHLFASMLRILEPGSEATDKDIIRLELIRQELEDFGLQFESEIGKQTGV